MDEEKVIEWEREWLEARLEEHPDIVTGVYHKELDKLKDEK